MQNINVNIVPDSYPQSIRYSQGDIGREFKINVVGFTIPSGATVKIQATKPSGFGFSVAGTVDGNAVSFTTTEVMTDEAGRFPAELQITKDGDVIGTANFIMWGEANPHPEGTTDGSQGTIIPELTLLVERVEAAASSVLDMQVVAETLAAGSQASYSYDEDTNTATFGIPQGEAGAGAAGVVASAYSSSKTYKVGDYVLHNSNLYRCITAITTAEAFTVAHWTQIVLADDVSDLKTDLDEYADIFTADVSESVSNWLDEHPEATTTVEDESLTEAKFTEALKHKTIKDYVTPEMFGGVGDGVTDDTQAIQSAIDSGKSVVFESKTYKVTTLYLQNFLNIEGRNNATIKSEGVAFEAKPNITYLHDVRINGVTIEAVTGIDLSSRQYDNYTFKLENVIFNCTDYCINATKCFQWLISNVKISGQYGFKGMNGPSNTFINIYEVNCENMFINCDGVFININTSNSGLTEKVFDYTDGSYGHNLTVLNSNFENVKGTIIESLLTNGFSNITLIGLTVNNPQLDDYLLILNNPRHIFIQMRSTPSGSKFINLIGDGSVKSFYINKNVPFAINGYTALPAFQEASIPSGWYYGITKFSGIEAKLIRGCVTPITEEIALAYTIRISSGSHIKITDGVGQDLGKVQPFYSSITGRNYFGVGTIITIENASSSSFNLFAPSTPSDYVFATSQALAVGETKSFILQNNGTNLYWKEI